MKTLPDCFWMASAPAAPAPGFDATTLIGCQTALLVLFTLSCA